MERLDEMHSYFSSNDFSLNLLMQVDGFLDEKKAAMLAELDAFLALSKREKQVYILVQRSGYFRYPLDVVNDQEVLRQVLPEIEKQEKDGRRRVQPVHRRAQVVPTAPAADRQLVLGCAFFGREPASGPALPVPCRA